MKKRILFLGILVTIFTGNLFSQNENVFPVQVKEKFPDITLTSADGELVTLPESGRNTLLIFIRGKVLPTLWCPICHYQYLEMIEAVQKTNMAEQYDMDIYFVMPYQKDSLQNWIKAFPQSLETIHRWKNPESETEQVLAWRDYAQVFFSKEFTFDVENPNLKLPVLFDPDQKVSNELLLYKQEWGGTKVPQNIPTVYIMNKEGKVIFKYFSQYTNDRPDAAYLIEMIQKML